MATDYMIVLRQDIGSQAAKNTKQKGDCWMQYVTCPPSPPSRWSGWNSNFMIIQSHNGLKSAGMCILNGRSGSGGRRNRRRDSG